MSRTVDDVINAARAKGVQIIGVDQAIDLGETPLTGREARGVLDDLGSGLFRTVRAFDNAELFWHIGLVPRGEYDGQLSGLLDRQHCLVFVAPEDYKGKTTTMLVFLYADDDKVADMGYWEFTD